MSDPACRRHVQWECRLTRMFLTVLVPLIVVVPYRSHAEIYNVGPEQALATPLEVPWESLNAGDTVRIHWRVEPYRVKWVLCRQGSKEQPILIEGISGPGGEQPVIDGENARTPRQLDYWGEQRSLIKIGGANRPVDTLPRHIWIKNLELRNSRPPFRFTGRRGETLYEKQSAGIFVEKGEHIRISHCTIRDNGNGIMSSWHSRFLHVEHCHIHSNGVERSGLEHNVYIDGIGAKFEFNRFGPLRADCLGVNFKSRASQTILRYNWIEGGKRCVNIVDTHHQPVLDDPGYRDTFVYGNVIIRDDRAPNNQVVHYGGDLHDLKWYRKGTLHFYHNTVITNRRRSTTLFLISSDGETVDCRNNIIYRPPESGNFALLAEGGKIRLRHNWISREARTTFGGDPQVLENSENIRGTDPGFRDFAGADFRLVPQSPCRDIAGALASQTLPSHAMRFHYRLHQQKADPVPETERSKRRLDLGAFALSPDVK